MLRQRKNGGLEIKYSITRFAGVVGGQLRAGEQPALHAAGAHARAHRRAGAAGPRAQHHRTTVRTQPRQQRHGRPPASAAHRDTSTGGAPGGHGENRGEAGEGAGAAEGHGQQATARHGEYATWWGMMHQEPCTRQ